LRHLQGAQVFGLSHLLPEFAGIGVIFVNAIDKSGSWQRCARKPKIYQFRLNGMPRHREVGQQDCDRAAFTDRPCVDGVTWVPCTSINSVPSLCNSWKAR